MATAAFLLLLIALALAIISLFNDKYPLVNVAVLLGTVAGLVALGLNLHP